MPEHTFSSVAVAMAAAAAAGYVSLRRKQARDHEALFPGSRAALIGYTGYVGGNLHAQGGYDGVFNSKNIGDIGKRHWKTVVCAGAPGFKIGANVLKQTFDGKPYNDTVGMDGLIRDLSKVRTDLFVLISTLSVYAVTSVAESEALHGADAPPGTHALNEDLDVWSRKLSEGGLSDSEYGRNRARLEAWVRKTFPNHLIIRLPGIIGPGMKKNYIFDLVTESPWRHKIDLHTRHQWYPLRLLTRDVRAVLAHNAEVTDPSERISVINLFPEPVPTRRLVERFFPAQVDICRGTSKQKKDPSSEFVDDVRTAHTFLWPQSERGPERVPGGAGGFRLTAESSMCEMEQFLQEHGAALRAAAAAAVAKDEKNKK